MNPTPPEGTDVLDPTARLEHDLIGDCFVPADALYGVHTARARENFPISAVAISSHPYFIRALASVKLAAARANHDLGLIETSVFDAIDAACLEVIGGRWHEHFCVDVIQGGAGTSTNMNANEVIANRALQILGHGLGEYSRVHPLDHVNKSQSTNDVYPSAVKLALHELVDELLIALLELQAAVALKANEFADVVKVGRTQLQDAVPMTVGRELGAFAQTIAEDHDRLVEAQTLLRELNLGATAVGTGITAPPGYAEAVRRHLVDLTGVPFSTAPDLVEATQDAGVFMHLSGVLRRVAVKLSKMCNDFRLLSSGPRTGMAELVLPPVQAGSSIMPGKVNPVIPEMVNQVAFEVIGHDVTITMAVEAGQLQLNAFGPIIAHSLFESLVRLRQGTKTLTERCVAGLGVNRERIAALLENSLVTVVALVPEVGYQHATEVAQEAATTGSSVREVVLARGLLTPTQIDKALAAAARPHDALVVG